MYFFYQINAGHLRFFYTCARQGEILNFNYGIIGIGNCLINSTGNAVKLIGSQVYHLVENAGFPGQVRIIC